jgi:hypothetical protein
MEETVKEARAQKKPDRLPAVVVVGVRVCLLGETRPGPNTGQASLRHTFKPSTPGVTTSHL